MTKDESKIINGVAIILMILLHVTAGSLFEVKSIFFPDEYVTAVARSGKICVSIFAFTSGYGLWTLYKKDVGKALSTTAKELIYRAVNFIFHYWPFVICGAILKFCYTSKFDIGELIKNLAGLDWTYNGAWWYVRYYFVMLLVIHPVSILIYKNGISRLTKRMRFWITAVFSVAMTIGCYIVGGGKASQELFA